jgi:hypothetical protein
MKGQDNGAPQRRTPSNWEARLAGYVAATTGGAALLHSEAAGAVVGSTAVQPFGINQEVNIDFNGDGHTDFQIDHDRYNLNGTNLDYLQVDKNDASSAADPFALDAFATFPVPEGVTANDGHEFLKVGLEDATTGYYGAALAAGESIGPTPTGERVWAFGESDNAHGVTGLYQRTNRLIDEDAGQIDQSVGRTTLVPTVPSEWLGLNGQVRYIGTRIDLNNASSNDSSRNYGWIGIRITNEADATGEVVGYGYETDPETPILAGDAGTVAPNADYDDDGDVDGEDFLLWQRQFGNSVTAFSGADGNGNGTVDAPDLALWQSGFGSATAAGSVATAAVPEPGSFLLGGIGGLLLLSRFALRRRTRQT